MFLSDAPRESLKQALDLTSLNHEVTSHNLANAAVPGFRPFRVELQELRGEPEVVRQSTEVDRDLEMARLADNSLRHQVLAQLLSGRYRALQAVLGEGR